MALSQTDWAKMTADERREHTASQKAKAIESVNSGAFPTGIKVVVGGKTMIARPVRVTDSGGVTYSIAPHSMGLDKFDGRFNKFSFTLLGKGKADAGGDSFDNEELI